MNQNTGQKEKNELRQVLLGVLDELSKTVEKSSMALADRIKKLNEINAKLQKVNVSSLLMGKGSKSDVDTMKKIADVLDATLQDLSHANRDMKQERLQKLSKEVDNTRNSMRPGR